VQAIFWVEDPMDTDLVTLRSDFRRRVKRRFDEVGLTLGPPSGHELSGELDVAVDDPVTESDGVNTEGTDADPTA
jgi:hypothetical protein